MREILFRGKRLDNGEWVEGNYILQNDSDPKRANYMVPHIKLRNCVNMYAVDPATIGQYTGLKDKNGKRIFEGDVVDILTENEEIGVVSYEDGGFLVNADGFSVDFHSNIYGTDLEIIGNIHDNPELLEGG